jgi:hypothetical protein
MPLGMRPGIELSKFVAFSTSLMWSIGVSDARVGLIVVLERLEGVRSCASSTSIHALHFAKTYSQLLCYP